MMKIQTHTNNFIIKNLSREVLMQKRYKEWLINMKAILGSFGEMSHLVVYKPIYRNLCFI